MPDLITRRIICTGTEHATEALRQMLNDRGLLRPGTWRRPKFISYPDEESPQFVLSEKVAGTGEEIDAAVALFREGHPYTEVVVGDANLAVCHLSFLDRLDWRLRELPELMTMLKSENIEVVSWLPLKGENVEVDWWLPPAGRSGGAGAGRSRTTAAERIACRSYRQPG